MATEKTPRSTIAVTEFPSATEILEKYRLADESASTTPLKWDTAEKSPGFPMAMIPSVAEPSKPLSRSERRARRKARQAKATAPPNSLAIRDAPRAACPPRHDAFISYAGEDRGSVARPLSEALAKRGWTSWFAEREMTGAGSPRTIIDRGLRASRFGIVVLSRNYFGKFWPEAELDALLAREERLGQRIVVPVLHGITRDELAELSPIMAGRMTINASHGVDRAANEVSRAFEKELGHGAQALLDFPAPMQAEVPAYLSQAIPSFSMWGNSAPTQNVIGPE